MVAPELVLYGSVAEYKSHYERVYVRGEIITFDNIRVYFRKEKFGHVFWKSSDRSGKKDVFAPERAQRIDWIKATLEHPDSEIFFGWDKKHKRTEYNRRVSVVYESFIVVIEISRRRDSTFKGNFITAYLADEKSLVKIKNGPVWIIEDIN